MFTSKIFPIRETISNQWGGSIRVLRPKVLSVDMGRLPGMEGGVQHNAL
jgi:hypothetical protein